MDLFDNNEVLVAEVVYAIMNQKYHISRNLRAQWFLKHLNTKITFTPKNNIFQYGEESEIEVISVCPHDPPPDWSPESSHVYQYLVTPATNIVFLSHVSKAVYCLDMSPSISAVDIQQGEVMIDEIITAIRNSIEGVVRPFRVPGSCLVFEPDLFVTVIVHTPFFTTPAQQVLVQGWRVTAVNVDEFLSAIIKQLELLEDTIADVSGLVHDQIDALRMKQAESERLVGGLFEELNDKLMSSSVSCNISMVGPDLGFINLLRYGMLALRLLPPTNLSNLVVVTDGMITLPDIDVLDSVLSQLRSNAVSVSFLHVGSQFHPHCCHGLVPYSELMQFITSATLGAYVSSPPKTISDRAINVYHEMFTTWGFRNQSATHELMTPVPKHGDWNISNQSFYGNREPQLLTKKQSEERLNASLTSVLFCRLHEGYMIKNVLLKDDDLEVTLVLPWSNHIFIEYIITAAWPEIKRTNVVHCVVSIKAPYEFLHDITCLMKKRFHSPYRQAVVSRFWSTLKTLSHTDLLLSRLDSFASTPLAYYIPDSIKNGMPLFYLPSNATPPTLSSSGSSCLPFAQFWRPVVMLEPSVWQKWFHTNRLGVILQPDRPLPHSLFSIANSTRTQVLQCRQAAATLYNALKKLTTFVLIENHSYIKIIPPGDGDRDPNWFSIIRVTSKPPCAVIHIAFLGGTPGIVRHQVVEEIKNEIVLLKIPQRSDVLQKPDSPVDTNRRSDVDCCTLLHKPLEKILIRYERMPCEFRTVVFPDGTQPVSAAKPLRPTSTLITTLSRYLHHKRSIWDAHSLSASHNNTLPAMLTTLTKMRLQEGFRFAHCTAGIINMVLEVEMKCYDDDKPVDNEWKYQPCIIQYVLFPPHMTSTSTKGSNSGDEGTDEPDGEVRTELITECWIEPQHGVVTRSPPSRSYMENLQYHQIADMIWRVDVECISNLLTFDHLQLMCHNQQIMPPLSLDPLMMHQNPLENWPHAVALEDERIHNIPFAYNLLNILPKCQQAEILSSMFIQEINDQDNKSKQDAPNILLMESLLSNLQELHHRELHLNSHESSQLLQLIVARNRDVSQHPVPFPTLEESSEDLKTKSSFKLGAWSSKKQQATVPKWRCFIKSMASTHCVLTFIPTSFHDLKMLMLRGELEVLQRADSGSDVFHEQEAKLVLESTLNPEAEPFHPGHTSVDSSHSNIRHSTVSSVGCIEDNSTSEYDSSFDSIKSQDFLRDSFKTAESQSPFRVRSCSWDTVKKQGDCSKMNSFRIRTSSVGSKLRNYAENRNELSPSDETSVKYEDVVRSNSKPVTKAITLPIYIYDCPLQNLVDALIFKSDFEQRAPDIFIDRTNKNSKLDKPSGSGESESASTPDELDLQHHCQVISQAFGKCFTISLFKSLHLGYKVNSSDILAAVDDCEKTLLEIDITKYIETVCGHYKNISSKEGSLKASLSSFRSICLPPEIMPLHKLVKKRFLEILTVCFKPVPSSPEFYYCCPPSQLSKIADIGGDSHRVMENHEFEVMCLQAEGVESSQDNIIGGWERTSYAATPDDARTSLLSNIDSESIGDFPEDDMGEEISPLFLHLVRSVKSLTDDFVLHSSGRILPTCLGELLDDPTIYEDIELDLQNLVVSLDLHFLTLAPTYSTDIAIRDVESHYTEAGSLPKIDQQIPQNSEVPVNGFIDRFKHLPSQQQKAIAMCVSEIKWLLQDEIAVFLLETYPVSENTLSFVANHIENSIDRYSCTLNTLHLDFVFGVSDSLKQFIQELGQMKIPGYCLKQEHDFYYLIKDLEMSANSTTSSQNIAEINLSTGEDLKLDYMAFYQLDGSRNGLEDSLKDSFETQVFPHQWIMNVNHYRPTLPNFWLFLKVEKEVVTCYFHCRFLDINCEEVRQYRSVHSRVLESIEAVCKTVNQTLLLQSLHDTRICDQLLEPETNDDIWKPNQDLFNRSKSLEDGVDLDVSGDYLETVSKFLPGWFSCPVVWQTHFVLHPRLKTGPGKPGLSRAIQALRTVLNRFSVNNRTNMFVYQDRSGNNVFYLRLHENIRSSIKQSGVTEDDSPGSVSRSSSINSLNNKKPPEDVTSREIRPRLKSFGESIEKEYSKQEDFLTLKVHGITEAGAEVKSELVQVLQNRLDDAVLEVLSVMLARNPMCKLSPDDVYFIQKPNHVPGTTIKFTIPDYANKYLQALSYYLRQNLLQFLFVPKYIDNRHQFQDYSEPEGSLKRMSDLNIYLYNQSLGTGSKGIACLGVALVDKEGKVISQLDYAYTRPGRSTFESQPIEASDFQSLTHCERLLSENNGQNPEAYVEVRLWKQGRVNLEALILKLKSAVQYSLWDLTTEFNILTAPLTEQLPGESVSLHNVYYKVISDWFQYGSDLNVPSVRMHTFSLSSRHSVCVTLKEVHSLVLLHESTAYLFYENTERKKAMIYQSSIEMSSSGKCFLIACNPSLWRISFDSDTSSPYDLLDPKGQKTVQKFAFYFHRLPDGIVQYVPRQRILITLINSQEVYLYTYNWAKDRVENLIKSLTQLGHWLSARSNFLTGILLQKMGLFHDQPYMRKNLPQSNFADGTEIESLISFNIGTNVRRSGYGTLSSVTQALRDSKPLSFRKALSDPVVANVHQIFDIRMSDKKEQQKKLCMMWQSRGATPNIPLMEDTLDLFMQYSRVIHYCLTPLLFLTQWRIQSAATRDHSLKDISHHSQSSLSDPSPKQEEKWHQNLCANFVNEYKQYLQTLGFIPIQTAPNTPHKIGRIDTNLKADEKPSCYLQKSLLGGILLFEIFLSEPFFHAKLHSLEFSRLQSTTSSSLVSQFTLSFLDECDKVKVLMHLHSFTYDYHLRCLHWYISERQSLLRPDYHLTSFLDDFLKYYPKAPNYARSLVYSGSLTVSQLITPPSKLFDYLLSHAKDYGMDILRMLPQDSLHNNDQNPTDIEYILVKLGSTPHVTYKDAQDIKQTDDFDVTLIVSHEETSFQSSISLRYYILLTSRRELYPKLEIERKLGKFCTVSTANPLSIYKSVNETQSENSEGLQRKHSTDSIHHREIRQESVNYLGYYSSHEQLMQQLILEEALAAEKHIQTMISKGSVDCRTHILWNKLLSTPPAPCLTYSELFELTKLAHVQSLLSLDSRLTPMLAQPMSWYQGLMKILIAKHADRYKIFTSSDNNTQHLLILHPRFLNGFVMLTIDTSNTCGELSVIYRHWPCPEKDVTASDIHTLVEGVVNACCYHLWSSLLT